MMNKKKKLAFLTYIMMNNKDKQYSVPFTLVSSHVYVLEKGIVTSTYKDYQEIITSNFNLENKCTPSL